MSFVPDLALRAHNTGTTTLVANENQWDRTRVRKEAKYLGVAMHGSRDEILQRIEDHLSEVKVNSREQFPLGQIDVGRLFAAAKKRTATEKGVELEEVYVDHVAGLPTSFYQVTIDFQRSFIEFFGGKRWVFPLNQLFKIESQ